MRLYFIVLSIFILFQPSKVVAGESLCNEVDCAGDITFKILISSKDSIKEGSNWREPGFNKSIGINISQNFSKELEPFLFIGVQNVKLNVVGTDIDNNFLKTNVGFNYRIFKNLNFNSSFEFEDDTELVEVEEIPVAYNVLTQNIKSGLDLFFYRDKEIETGIGARAVVFPSLNSIESKNGIGYEAKAFVGFKRGLILFTGEVFYNKVDLKIRESNQRKTSTGATIGLGFSVPWEKNK